MILVRFCSIKNLKNSAKFGSPKRYLKFKGINFGEPTLGAKLNLILTEETNWNGAVGRIEPYAYGILSIKTSRLQNFPGFVTRN